VKAYFKCRPPRNASVGGFVAWCAFQPLTMADAVTEPAEPVFFDFGQTEAQAIQRLQAGMDAKWNVTEWQRQEVN
jgi:hypothetical protein